MKFDKIQKIKKCQELYVNNINMAQVMAAKLYNNGFVFFFKTLLLSLFFEPDFIFKANESEILISRNFDSNKRKDYDYIYKKLKESLNNFNEIIFVKRFRPFSFLSDLRNTITNYKKNQPIDISFKERIIVSLLENYFNKLLKKIEVSHLNPKVYISFCDSYLEENLMAQFFNFKDITTSTLQHGQYRVNNENFESTDAESYLNFVSNYLFAWGEKTKSEFIKAGISPDRIKVLGALKPFTDLKRDKFNYDTKSFVVNLNGENHADSNFEMINLANKIAEYLDYKFYIRPHPMNNLTKYTKRTNGYYKGLINSPMETYDHEFAIVHSSGVLLELMSMDFPYFVFRDNYLDKIFHNEYNNFSELKEFQMLHEKYSCNYNDLITLCRKNYNQFNASNDEIQLLSNYRHAIQEIISLSR